MLHTYKWVLSHRYKWVVSQTYEWVMSHMWMSHVTHIWMCHVIHIWMSHVTHKWMCHVTHTWMSRVTHLWMCHVTHVWISSVTRMNESCYPYVSHIWMRRHVTHMCRTYEWDVSHVGVMSKVESRRRNMSRIWMSHGTHTYTQTATEKEERVAQVKFLKCQLANQFAI